MVQVIDLRSNKLLNKILILSKLIFIKTKNKKQTRSKVETPNIYIYIF